MRASPLAVRGAQSCDFGLYLDARWAPTWPAVVISWEDYGLPWDFHMAATAIRDAFERARAGEVVEVEGQEKPALVGEVVYLAAG